MLFRKKMTYKIDQAKGDELLQNIFEGANRPKNTIPFDKIILQRKLDLLSDNLIFWVALFLFAITLVAPLFFPHPSFKVSVDPSVSRHLGVNSHRVEDGCFYVSITGGDVDPVSSYMLSDSDEKIFVKDFNKGDNELIFPYNAVEYNIYIYDYNGNMLHLLLAPRE